MAVNPYAQSWATDTGTGSPEMPATKPGKNPMEPSGMTTRSPWEKVIPQLEDYLKQGPGGSAVTTGPVYGALARSNATDLSGLQGLLGSTSAPTASEKYLTGMAQNSGVDPYAQQVFQASQDKLANSINDRFSSIGRYGSRDYAQGLGSALGTANAQFNSDQWNAAQQRKLAATGMLDAAGQNRFGQQAGILGSIANLQGSNYDRKLAALGGQTATQGGIDAQNNQYWQNVFGLGNTYGTGINYDVPTPLWEKLLGGGIGLLGAFGGLMK